MEIRVLTRMFGHIYTKVATKPSSTNLISSITILVISFQTQAELLRWADAAGWGERRREHLESRMQKLHDSTFVGCDYLCGGPKRWKALAETDIRFRLRTPG